MKHPSKTDRVYEAVMLADNRRIELRAANRRKAVTKALHWFWYEFHGSLGPAHKNLVVTDPYHEVRYGPAFVCNDRMNKLLPPEVVERVLRESNGELEIDRREWRPHHAPNSLKRVKRRRDFGRFIAPCIRQMKSGAMYYRITVVPQRTKGQRVIQKRKYRDIRLKARTLVAAIDEIKLRGLRDLNQMRRKMKVRDLTFTAHIGGLITASVLTEEQKKKFSRVIRQYVKPCAA